LALPDIVAVMLQPLSVVRLRRLPRLAQSVSLPWLLLLGGLHGCSLGGQTGDGDGVLPPDEKIGPDPVTIQARLPCEMDEVQLSDLDAEVPELGFAPREVLAAIAASDTAAGTWAPLGDLSTEPESGAGEVELTFDTDAAQVVLLLPHVAELDAGMPAEEAQSQAALCPAALQVNTTGYLSTAGGALDESFAATLTAYVPEVVVFTGHLAPGDLKGALQVTPEGEESRLREPQFNVDGVLTELGHAGVLTVIGEYTAVAADADEPAAEFVSIALQWPPPELCGSAMSSSGVFPIESAAQVSGYAVRDGLLAFSDLGPLQLTWLDESVTQLELEVSQPLLPCVMIEPTTANVALGYQATIQATTEDERWNGSYPALIQVRWSPQGELLSSDLATVLTVTASQSESLGFPALQDEGAGAFEFGLSVSQDHNSGVLSGHVSVGAIVQSEGCADAASAEPTGCPSEFELLEDAQFGR
jgi:hypothetical protein